MFVSVATSRGLNVLNGAAHTQSFADALCRSVTSIIKDSSQTPEFFLVSGFVVNRKSKKESDSENDNPEF